MSRVNKSCHVWMSHVTCGWVMSRVNESCQMWKRHVTCVWDTSHVRWSKCKRGMSHVMWMSRRGCLRTTARFAMYVFINESRHVYIHTWVMSHVVTAQRKRHVTCEMRHMGVSHVTREWDMSHVVWMSRRWCLCTTARLTMYVSNANIYEVTRSHV